MRHKRADQAADMWQDLRLCVLSWRPGPSFAALRSGPFPTLLSSSEQALHE